MISFNVLKVMLHLFLVAFCFIRLCDASDGGIKQLLEIAGKEAAITSPQPKVINHEDDGYISRLTTHDEHIQALETAFEDAQKSILVTNYGRLYGAILKTNLFMNIIPQAVQRGVKIYLRYNYDQEKENDYSPIPEVVQDYFGQHSIDAALVQTHAKIVAVDHQLVMIGSYNWLTELTSKYSSHNNSFVYEGGDAYYMTEDIWQVIKYYRNKEFSPFHECNRKKAFAYRRDPNNQSSILYPLNENSIITYVPFIDEHRRKLLDIFESVKDRIIMLSPFVSYDGSRTYQRDFVHELLSTVLKRDIFVCFVCLPTHKSRIDAYLSPLLIPYANQLKVITYDKVHAKTLILDNRLIAEGSFNWLCAARDEITPSHKHEATLMCEGEAAKSFIRHFDQSEIGKKIRQSKSNSRTKVTTGKRPLSQITDSRSSKRQRKSNLINNSEKAAFFNSRREALEMELWSHNPLWVELKPNYHYLSHGKFYDVMSGFNNEGYCARVEKQYYLMDEADQIIYFPTIEAAKEATYGF